MPFDPIRDRVREAAVCVSRAGRHLAWLRGGAWLVTAVVGLVVVDVLLRLPALPRVVLALAWGGAVAVVVVWGLLVGRRFRGRSADFFAALIERRHDGSGGAIVNAVQFDRALGVASVGGVLSRPLMLAEIDRGRVAARDVAPARCVERGVLVRYARFFTVAGVVLLGTALLWPGVYAAVLPRFYDPLGDHPPFCLTRFDIRYESENTDGRVYYGDAARVFVGLSGHDIPETAWLEIGDVDGAHRVDLIRAGDAEWSTRFERLERDVRFRAHVPRGYSRWQTIELDPTPRIRDVTVRYEPPAYVGRPSYTEPLDTPGIRGLVGTRAAVTVTANRPLARSALVFEPEGGAPVEVALEPDPVAPQTAAAAIVLSRPGTLAGPIRSEDGHQSHERLHAAVRPIEDGAPRVRVEEPGRDALVVAGAGVPLRVVAEDDVGVERLELHRAIAGRDRETIDLGFEPPGAATVQARTTIDTAALDLRPGDTLEYLVTATDNHPERPNRADSERYRLTVISEAEYAEHLRMQAGMEFLAEHYLPLIERYEALAAEFEALRREAERVADALAAAPQDSPVSQELQRRLEALAARDQELRRQAGALADQMEKVTQMPEVYDVQRHLNRQLAGLMRDLRRSAERRASRDLERALGGGPPTAGQARPPVMRVLSDLKKDVNELGGPASQQAGSSVQEPVEMLEQVYELMALTELFKAYATAQADLADNLSRLRDHEPLSDTDVVDIERYGGAQRKLADDVAAMQQAFREKGGEVRAFAGRLRAEAESLRATTRPSHAPASAPADEPAETTDPAEASLNRAARLEQFAAKAVEIADRMEALAITADMRTAASRLAERHVHVAYAAAESAAEKMRSMIKKCQAAAGAGQSCLTLDIVEFGESLGQAMQSMSAASMATGQAGVGQGQGGYTIGGGDMMVYGAALPTNASSSREPEHRDEAAARLVPLSEVAGPAAVETIAPDAPVEIDLGPLPGETVPARYRDVTNAYFRRLAEDER